MANPVRPDVINPETDNPDPVRHGLARPDLARPNLTRPDPVRSDPIRPDLVIKLGGSLWGSSALADTVEMIARSPLAVVVVPGGGPLADAVRSAQAQLQITDAIAHRLAILSLNQMAIVIAARHARCVLVETLDEIDDAMNAGRVPVWQPYHVQHDDDTIPADWNVTSDALAARLAERIGCSAVALIKSCAIPAGLTAAAAAGQGIADPVFADVVARAGLQPEFYGPGDMTALSSRLACQ